MVAEVLAVRPLAVESLEDRIEIFFGNTRAGIIDGHRIGTVLATDFYADGATFGAERKGI